jgi:putative PIN family toxin of toxin-antitoxin system
VIRAVIDTNVLASAIAHANSVPGVLIELWRQERFELLLSETILTELRRTLRRPYFVDNTSAEDRNTALALLESGSERIRIPAILARVATHPEDDLILATAVQGQAQYLVTGDRQLQLLGSHAGVAIVSPRAFLDALDG